jgi:hypothetical protein
MGNSTPKKTATVVYTLPPHEGIGFFDGILLGMPIGAITLVTVGCVWLYYKTIAKYNDLVSPLTRRYEHRDKKSIHKDV